MQTNLPMRVPVRRARARTCFAASLLVLAASCASLLEELATTPDNETPPTPGTSLTPVTASVRGTAGALYARPLRVRYTVDGAPRAGVTVQWATGGGNGWVFPAASVTNGDGVASTQWVAGPNAAQSVRARVGGDTARIAAQVGRTVNRANSVHLWHYTPGEARADGFRIDLVPQTDPHATYYEAIGFDGGYAGIQAGGDLGGKQVIFSVWDADGASAVLVDAAGSACEPFGNEGTGIKCRFPYPWATGRTYRFELRATFGARTTDFTARFTDVQAGTTRTIATLRYGKVSSMEYNYPFVEDFGPESASCLDAAYRAVILRDPRYLDGGTWRKFTSADFTSYHQRDVCANISATTGAPGGGILLTTGGSTVGDPTASTTLAVP